MKINIYLLRNNLTRGSGGQKPQVLKSLKTKESDTFNFTWFEDASSKGENVFRHC